MFTLFPLNNSTVIVQSFKFLNLKQGKAVQLLVTQALKNRKKTIVKPINFI